ncbi:MAG: LysR substrate-binding domain-containing protein, partial [Lachnospiraceae bacterium]|nr:LysR substrate-binding domain-containing protein [Lachnospiraceae bacterium]
CLIDAKWLNDQVFIQGTQSYGLTRLFNLICSLYHITPKYRLNVGNCETAYFLAGAGIGITMSPKLAHDFPLHSEAKTHPVLCSIKGVPLERTFILACRAGRSEEPLILWIADLIKQLFFNR